MSINCYMAMTGAEISTCQTGSPHVAWMACHFSSYSKGLSNLPQDLPKESMIILDDSTPPEGHEPEKIADQLITLAEKLSAGKFLLDFQHPGNEELKHLADFLVDALPYPVGVTHYYAKELNCPLYLPPVPLNVSLAKHLQPWKGREIWLEAAIGSEIITLTKDGIQTDPQPYTALSVGHYDPKLHCHYAIRVQPDAATFTLTRDQNDLRELLDEAQQFGVTLAIGLYQQLK